MSELNLTLLHWLAAGSSPEPVALLLARLLALWGVWACAVAIGSCAWARIYVGVHYPGDIAAGMALGALLAAVLALFWHVTHPTTLGAKRVYGAAS